MSITPAGRELACNLVKILYGFEDQVAGRMDKKDLESFDKLMAAIAAVTAVDVRKNR